MTDVHDVAKYILSQRGSMSTWKLQKLVYYSQAWHLVWDDEPLFPEPIEAWANGPVVRKLYYAHKGLFEVGKGWGTGKISNLTKEQKATIDGVLSFYGGKTGHWLSELTHLEPPWQKAREGLDPNERGNRRIKRGDMADYYGQLPTA